MSNVYFDKLSMTLPLWAQQDIALVDEHTADVILSLSKNGGSGGIHCSLHSQCNHAHFARLVDFSSHLFRSSPPQADPRGSGGIRTHEAFRLWFSRPVQLTTMRRFQ